MNIFFYRRTFDEWTIGEQHCPSEIDKIIENWQDTSRNWQDTSEIDKIHQRFTCYTRDWHALSEIDLLHRRLTCYIRYWHFSSEIDLLHRKLTWYIGNWRATTKIEMFYWRFTSEMFMLHQRLTCNIEDWPATSEIDRPATLERHSNLKTFMSKTNVAHKKEFSLSVHKKMSFNVACLNMHNFTNYSKFRYEKYIHKMLACRAKMPEP